MQIHKNNSLSREKYCVLYYAKHWYTLHGKHHEAICFNVYHLFYSKFAVLEFLLLRHQLVNFGTIKLQEPFSFKI